jgi:hypothetical protein
LLKSRGKLGKLVMTGNSKLITQVAVANFRRGAFKPVKRHDHPAVGDANYPQSADSGESEYGDTPNRKILRGDMPHILAQAGADIRIGDKPEQKKAHSHAQGAQNKYDCKAVYNNTQSNRHIAPPP